MVAPESVPFTIEELDPWDERNRYRIYRLRKGQLELLATTPTVRGVGLTIATLSDEGEFGYDDRLGVLDGIRGRGKGRWMTNPFATGR